MFVLQRNARNYNNLTSKVFTRFIFIVAPFCFAGCEGQDTNFAKSLSAFFSPASHDYHIFQIPNVSLFPQTL